MLTDEELLEIVASDGTISLDPKRNYTPGELDQVSTAVLRADAKSGNHIKGKNPILFEEHIKNRHRREIFNKEGVPDPAFGQGQFNRTHPQGRKVNSEEQRKKNGAAFYR